MYLQVQRGFRSVVVYLTAVDSSRDFVAVGSSIGMLYLYCRRLAHMNKYSLEVALALFSSSFNFFFPERSSPLFKAECVCVCLGKVRRHHLREAAELL